MAKTPGRKKVPIDFRIYERQAQICKAFANPVRLHTALNPDFFKGTVVDDAVAKLTRSGSVPPSSTRSGH
jgi:hypothetical protein